MAEIRTVTTLKSKRDDITRAIAAYEKKLNQARADLAHINAAIRIFELGDAEGKFAAPYVDIYRLFKRGEMAAICRDALKDGPRNTRELALVVMKARGLDTGDKVLAKAIGYRLIHTLRIQARIGKLAAIGAEDQIADVHGNGCELFCASTRGSHQVNIRARKFVIRLVNAVREEVDARAVAAPNHLTFVKISAGKLHGAVEFIGGRGYLEYPNMDVTLWIEIALVVAAILSAADNVHVRFMLSVRCLGITGFRSILLALVLLDVLLGGGA